MNPGQQFKESDFMTLTYRQTRSTQAILFRNLKYYLSYNHACLFNSNGANLQFLISPAINKKYVDNVSSSPKVKIGIQQKYTYSMQIGVSL